MTDALDLLDQLISTKAKLRVTQKHLRGARDENRRVKAENVRLYQVITELQMRSVEVANASVR